MLDVRLAERDQAVLDIETAVWTSEVALAKSLGITQAQPAFEAAVLIVAYMAEAKTTDYAQASEAIEQASRESLTLGLKKTEQRRLYIKARVIDLAKENNDEQA